MTNQELQAFFDKITMLCVSCGEPMRFTGEWPVQYHPEGSEKNFNQAFRWFCRTCRLPHSVLKSGVCIGATMILSKEFEQLRCEDAGSSNLTATETPAAA